MSPREAAEEAERRVAFCLRKGRDHLNLAGLGLESLPEEFPQLTGLRYLDLTGNRLSEFPAAIYNFTDLRWLGLNGNRIAQLPEGIARLVHLERLYLRGNQLQRLPEDFVRLPRLVELDLHGNRIDILPRDFGWLKTLVFLSLEHNPLKALPPSMGSLESLQGCLLSLETLPPDQRAAWKEGEWEGLRKHLRKADEAELVNLELEARHKSELQRLLEPTMASLERFRAQMAELAPHVATLTDFREFAYNRFDFPRFDLESEPPSYRLGKLVLVGERENGKTCLQRALRGLPFIEGLPSTHGMTRVRLRLGLDGSLLSDDQATEFQEAAIDLQVWDMGGQSHYQHTHQMFFTPGAIYLAVTMPRRGGGEGSLHDWLELIRKRTGGQADVIVVATRCPTEADQDQSLTLGTLRAEFGEMIAGLVAVESKAPESEDGPGIAGLRRRIAELIESKQSQFRHRWLPGWADVFSLLGQHPAPFLRWHNFVGLCAEHKITEASEQRTLARTGSLIGTLLWREETPAGEDVLVLNPDWLNGAVARLLDDELTQQRHGLIAISDLPRVWDGKDREGKEGYSGFHEMLITLMEVNELAYRPREPGKQVGQGDLLLVTQMVEALPKEDVDAKWESIRPLRSQEARRIFTFAKPGEMGNGQVPDLIYLLIFRLRAFSLGRRDYREAFHWQRGLLVQDEYGSVGRVELLGDELHVHVRYRLGDGFLHSINTHIGDRDDSFWCGLEKTEFIPCGQACRRDPLAPELGRIMMAHCHEAEREGVKKVTCLVPSCSKFIDLRRVLAGALPTEEELSVEKMQDRLLSRMDTHHAENMAAHGQFKAEFGQHFHSLRDLVNMKADHIIEALADEGKEGPRLFSLKPLERRIWKATDWTHAPFQITLWCEMSRQPVPVFGGKEGKNGQCVIHIPRSVVVKLGTTLRRVVLMAAAYQVAGPLGVPLAAIPGSAQFGQNTAEWEAVKELAGALPTEGGPSMVGEEDFDPEWNAQITGLGLGYGVPFKQDQAITRFLRDEYRKVDPDWGGLMKRWDDRFGWVWAHPKWESF